MAEQRFEVGDRALQRSCRLHEPLDRQAPRRAEFQFGRSLVEQIDGRGLSVASLRPAFKMALSRAASCFGSSARATTGTSAANSASRSQTVCRAKSICPSKSSIPAARRPAAFGSERASIRRCPKRQDQS